MSSVGTVSRVRVQRLEIGVGHHYDLACGCQIRELCESYYLSVDFLGLRHFACPDEATQPETELRAVAGRLEDVDFFPSESRAFDQEIVAIYIWREDGVLIVERAVRHPNICQGE